MRVIWLGDAIARLVDLLADVIGIGIAGGVGHATDFAAHGVCRLLKDLLAMRGVVIDLVRDDLAVALAGVRREKQGSNSAYGCSESEDERLVHDNHALPGFAGDNQCIQAETQYG